MYDPSIVSLALNFIKNFDQYLENIKKEYLELNFVRHAQTSLNKKKLFLGSRIDPKITNIKRKKINNINLITNYSIEEFDRNTAKIKIKYLGKIKSLKNSLIENGFTFEISNNEWSLRLAG